MKVKKRNHIPGDIYFVLFLHWINANIYAFHLKYKYVSQIKKNKTILLLYFILVKN